MTFAGSLQSREARNAAPSGETFGTLSAAEIRTGEYSREVR